MTMEQLSLFDLAPTYPDKAMSCKFWHHEKQQWYDSAIFEHWSFAGLAGMPPIEHGPHFGRYVCLEPDGTFTMRKAKDKSFCKIISHLYFGEDSSHPRMLPPN
jgi:hypothetical protein